MPGAALDYITIKGFKSIASIEKLALRPINIVIGPNGSGKSNFIEGFTLFQALSDGGLERFVRASGGASRLLHFGIGKTEEILLTIGAGTTHYRIRLEPGKDNSLFPSFEAFGFEDREADTLYWAPLGSTAGRREAAISRLGAGFTGDMMLGDTQVGDLDAMEEAVGKFVLDHLMNWRIYHLHDTTPRSPMRQTSPVDDNRFLKPHGGNLPAFLYLLREQHYLSYSLIRRTVQSIAPFFDDFQLEPRMLNRDEIKLEWRHQDSDLYFDATSLSDGTLRFIALATLFLQPIELRPSIILVDEPELGLHPAAIQILASMIRHASVDTQVIASTQSSLLLDHFDPEDVLVADRVNGATQIQRLAPEPLAAWLADYSLGQLWEKNEIGGRPAPE